MRKQHFLVKIWERRVLLQQLRYIHFKTVRLLHLQGILMLELLRRRLHIPEQVEVAMYGLPTHQIPQPIHLKLEE